MKKLLAILLLLFYSNLVTAQVNIKPETARYFLEADDERLILQKQDSIQTDFIESLGYQIFLKDEIIRNYQNEDALYTLQWNLLVDEHNVLVDDNDDLTDKLARRKRLEVIGLIILTVLLFL